MGIRGGGWGRRGDKGVGVRRAYTVETENNTHIHFLPRFFYCEFLQSARQLFEISA